MVTESARQTNPNKPRLGVLLLSFASVLALGFSLSQHLRDSANRRELSEQRFAAIVSTSPRAEHLLPGKLVWQGLVRGEPIYAKEKIRTGATDFVYLNTFGGGELRLGDNANVEVDRAGGQLSAKLVSGRVAIDGITSLHLALPHGLLKLLSATAIVHVKTAVGTVFTLRKGRATLQLGSRTLNVVAGEVIAIAHDGTVKAAKSAIALSMPAESDVLASRDASLLVGLHWIPDQPAILTWEVATDPEFTRVTQKGLSHDGRATVRLAPGIYYWRVWDEKAVTSYVGRFEIVSAGPVKIVSPDNFARLPYWRDLGNLTFEWQVAAGEAVNQATYQVELSKRREFGDATIRLEGTATEKANRYRAVLNSEAKQALLSTGSAEWFWRIVTSYPNPPTALFSETRTISVKKLAGLDAPRLFFPKEDGIDTHPREQVTLSWGAVPEAVAYRVYLWRSGANRPAEATYDTTANLVKVSKRSLTLGQGYEWTVAPVGADGTVGGFAKKRKFRIFSSRPPRAPLPRVPQHGETVTLSAEGKAVKLAWEGAEPSSLIKVLIEKREGEREWRQVWTGSFDAGVTEAAWSPESPGSYRWWVNASDELGRSSEQSRLTEFDVVEPLRQRLPAPKLPAPLIDVKQ